MSAEIIDRVKSTAESHGINKVVVASMGGKSAIRISEALGKGVQVISVSEFAYGDDVKKKMKKLKMTPVDKADLVIQDIKEVREQLLKIGTGVKAALEVAIIAKNRELVEGKFIVIAGEKTGLDTALVLDTNHPEFESMFEPEKQDSVKDFITTSILR